MTRPAGLRLIELLPSLYRAKDATIGGEPLAALLRALGTELDALDESIRALLDDHFVERASAEALPRLAELMGARLLARDPRVNRAVVARSVAWRRRKGTLATLEEVLASTTGWGAEIDEGFRSLAVTQDMRHLLTGRGLTAHLRDPIALADPLSTRSPGDVGPVGLRPGESLDDARRRIGRADAARFAASPRTVDLQGWARPAALAVRTTRAVPVSFEDSSAKALITTSDGRRGFSLDPFGRPTPLLWDAPLEAADRIGALTAAHEPDLTPPAPPRVVPTLLTPTALAAAPEVVVASGALRIAVDGIPLLGPDPISEAPEQLITSMLERGGLEPVLRFAEPTRPSPGDVWRLELLASDPLLTSDGIGATTAIPRGEPPLERPIILAVTRVEGASHVRRAGTPPTWEQAAVEPLSTPTNTVVITVGSTTFVARLGLDYWGARRLALVDPSSPTAVTTIAIGGATLPSLILGAASKNATIFVVARQPDGSSSLWSVVVSAGPTATATRLDASATTRPPYHISPTMLVQGNRLFLFGGMGVEPSSGNYFIRGDLWSFTLSGGPSDWTRHHVRNPKSRAGAELLWQWGGLVLVGGHSVLGQLDPSVWHCDPMSARPIWRELPPLPIEPGRPGQLVARATTAGGVEALVWADRTRPAPFTLGVDKAAWLPDEASSEAVESGAPNPPLDGNAIFVGDDVFVIDAPPLPPSEVIFSLGGRRRLAFLPAIDLAIGQSVQLTLRADGSTVSDSSSLPGLYTDGHERTADAFRLGVPGRIDRHRYELRQRSYGNDVSLDGLPSDSSEIIGLDPRLGRFLLPRGAPAGEVTVSFHAGRGASIGAGCLPRARTPRPSWEDPSAPAPTPPDLAGAPVTAWVHPESAGSTVRRRGADILAHATIDQALAASSGAEHPVVGIIGSPKLGRVSLATGAPQGFSIVADPGRAPFITRDSTDPASSSMSIYPRFGGAADTEVWLGGLWLEGRLDLVLARGRVDLRWCTLGQPGTVALRIAGAGHGGAVVRRAAHESDVELRLYGCVVGAIEIPPWVRLTAAGCTFDGGANRAIGAAGAVVRLRHCTVRGAIEAGELQASSCALGGSITVDRRDAGWIRHSVLRQEGSLPRLHRCVDRAVSFASLDPASPSYLVLAENNGPALAVAELGRVPGAHDERSESGRELSLRTQIYTPMTLEAVHTDRVVHDLARMHRSSK